MMINAAEGTAANVYGSTSLGAASFLGKGSTGVASSDSWGQVFHLPLLAVGWFDFPSRRTAGGPAGR